MAAGYLCTVAVADGPVNKSVETPGMSQVDSPTALAKRVAELVSARPAQQLDILATDRDCATALASGWERVRRTLPRLRRQELVSPDAQAISRFLGLVEGRMQVPLPRIWEATVKSVKGYEQGVIWFPFPRTEGVSATGHRLAESEVSAPTRRGEQWIVRKGNETISLPAEDHFGPVDKSTVEVSGRVAFVALYGSAPDPYQLFSVDRSNGKVNWTSEVWAAGGFVNYHGLGWHVVGMRLVAEKLAVFGVSEGTAYIEVFDCESGENQYRFGTAYFGATD